MRDAQTRRSLDRAAAEKAAGPRFDEPTFAALAGAPGCVKVVALAVPAGSKAGFDAAASLVASRGHTLVVAKV